MDGLQMAQLSALLAMQSLAASTHNPGQSALATHLLGSAQGAIQAEAEKKARKDAEKKKSKGIGKALGAVGSVVAAPFTGGASLAFLPAAMSAGEGLENVARGNTGEGLGQMAGGIGMGALAYGEMPVERFPTPARTPEPQMGMSKSQITSGAHRDWFRQLPITSYSSPMPEPVSGPRWPQDNPYLAYYMRGY